MDAKCGNVHNVAFWAAVQNQQLRTDTEPKPYSTLSGNALWVKTTGQGQSLLCGVSLVVVGVFVSWYAGAHVVFC